LGKVLDLPNSRFPGRKSKTGDSQKKITADD